MTSSRWAFSVVGLAFCVGLTFCIPQTVHAGPWLTGPEQQFFEAMGVDARINGQTVKRTADLAAWDTAAQQARQPLKGHIQAISAAQKQMTPTKAEQDKLAEIQKKLQEAIQGAMRGVVIGALLGNDSFDQARASTSQMMQAGDANGPYVRQAWEIQSKWLARGLDARDTADRNLKAITDHLASRSGKTLTGDDFSLSMFADGKTLSLVGKSGSRPLRMPVVQIVMHRKSTGGGWTALNGLSSGIGLNMGIMNGADAVQGTELSVNQERAMNLPFASTLVLPDLAPESRINIDLNIPVEAIMSVETAELYVWTDQGSLHVAELDGLDASQRRVQVQIDKERAEAAPQQGPVSALFGRPPAQSQQPKSRAQTQAEMRAKAQQQAVQENLANVELRMAQKAMGRRDDKMAEYYLRDILRRYPDTSAARTAGKLVRKYDK
ncbi:hypothetical protein GC197_06035 [bacterium]|nr:hypothetical protein [bacterium]